MALSLKAMVSMEEEKAWARAWTAARTAPARTARETRRKSRRDLRASEKHVSLSLSIARMLSLSLLMMWQLTNKAANDFV